MRNKIRKKLNIISKSFLGPVINEVPVSNTALQPPFLSHILVSYFPTLILSILFNKNIKHSLLLI